MNSAISSFREPVSRSVLRVSAIVLAAGLISVPATARADDIVLRWNEIAAQTATATSPFNQSRVAAIVQLAVFEAVNAISGEYQPHPQPGDGAVARGISGSSSHHRRTQGHDDVLPGGCCRAGRRSRHRPRGHSEWSGQDSRYRRGHGRGQCDDRVAGG